MKSLKTPLILLLTLFILGCGAGGDKENKENDAQAFNDELVRIQDKALSPMTGIFDSSSEAKTQANLLAAVSGLEEGSNDLRALNFEGGGGLKLACIRLLKFYSEKLNGDYQVMLGLLALENPTEENLSQLHALDSTFAAEENEHYKVLQQEQSRFAEKFEFSLEQAPGN